MTWYGPIAGHRLLLLTYLTVVDGVDAVDGDDER